MPHQSAELMWRPRSDMRRLAESTLSSPTWHAKAHSQQRAHLSAQLRLHSSSLDSVLVRAKGVLGSPTLALNSWSVSCLICARGSPAKSAAC